MPTLPEGLLLRSATREDAQDIFVLNREHELAVSGESESTLTDVFELWDRHQMDLANNTCVITNSAGTLIGYTGVLVTSDGIMLDVHTNVRHTDPDAANLMESLLHFAETHAYILLADRPALPRTLYTWSFSQETTRLLEGYGYSVAVTDYRMEITLNEEPSVSRLPEGIIIRPFVSGQEERAVYNVIAEAFPDIDGKPYRPYDDWLQAISRGSHDPSMLYVAQDGDQIVGTTICRIYPENGDGYISQVAVRRGWRQRGIALSLLQTAFGEYYRRGMYRIQLEVNASSETGSHELYRRAGMHIHSRVHYMTKAL